MREVSFALLEGDTLAVVGPSGCGKTTLLSLIAGLLKPSGGTLAVAGRPVDPRRPGTALILQDYGLLPWKSVKRNVSLGLEIRGLPVEPAVKAMTEVGILEFANRWPHQLSGGQRQRVAIARSLALDPDLLLMDEPFSALDAMTREEMQELLLGILQHRRTGIILVTHSIAEAVYLGKHVLVLTPGPGRVAGYFQNDFTGDRRIRGYHDMVNAIRDCLKKGVAAGD